jgi:hypothetical protein
LNPHSWEDVHEQFVGEPPRRFFPAASGQGCARMVKRGRSLAMRRLSAAVLGDDTLPIAAIAEPERLVGLGFRYWLNGFRTGDIGLLGKGVGRLRRQPGPGAGQGCR